LATFQAGYFTHMTHRFLARAAAILLLSLSVSGAAAEQVPKTGNRVIDRTIELVGEHFFSPAALPAFHAAVAAEIAEAKAANRELSVDDTIRDILLSLDATHTGRTKADRVDYYELVDVFRGAVRRDIRRLFPPDGEVTYEGIGIASRVIDGKRFVTDVYDGAPAARAGVMAGDEIVSVDGQPFSEIGSFAGKAGKSVGLVVRRTIGAEPRTVSVAVERLQPLETFLKAIGQSVRIVERDGKKIGVVHLWSYTSDRMTELLSRELATRLKDVDGLVLDLRSRWGGAPADAAELFVGDTADMTMTGRDGETRYVNSRFRKPVVAVIDEGTRSGMEILSYSLQKNGVPLIGTPTAGAVVAGTGYILPDDSFLILAVADVHVDGKRLEHNPVQPDIAVPFDVRYAAGSDPQLDRAFTEMDARLAGVAGGSVN
jgi:C-terminal processing protease CtpA/Prc